MGSDYLDWMIGINVAIGILGSPVVVWSYVVERRMLRIKAEIREMDALYESIQQSRQQEPPCDTSES